MATIGSNVLTLTDWAKWVDPDGKTKYTDIANILSQNNVILEDMPFKEGNLPTGEQVQIVTGLPTSYYRLINQGTPDSKATMAQVVENAAILEARSEIDVDVATLEANVDGFRIANNNLFMESMAQTQAETLIYGSAASPEEYVGLANRYNDLSATNATNILSAGGSGSDNTSIWLVCWGFKSAYGVYPKGSKAGLSHENLGVGDAFDSSNNRFRAYMDLFKWKNGLVVKDWRFLVRICNIDVSDLVALTGTQALTAATSIVKLMSRAIDRIPTLAGVKPVFYCNRTVSSHLRIIGLEKSSSAVTVQEGLNQFGQNIFTTRFLGIPVRQVDRILDTEAAVV